MQRNRLISDDIMYTIPSKEGMSAAEWLAEQMDLDVLHATSVMGKGTS